MTSTYLELLKGGFELIPLKPDNTPYTGWRKNRSLNKTRLNYHVNTVGMHVGVRLRATDLVVDVDRHPDRPDGTLVSGKLPVDLTAYPTVDTPSGGFHHLMTKPADIKTGKKIPGFDGIDFLSEGAYIVAVGSDYKTLGYGPYEWSLSGPELPCLAAPDELLAMLQDRESASGGTSDAEPEWSVDMLAEYLARLDPEVVADTNEKWIQLAAACHEATGGVGEEEFISWSLRDPLYADATEINRARWRSFTAGKKGAAGVGTLRSIALSAGISEMPQQAGCTTDFSGVIEETAPSDAVVPLSPLKLLTRDFKVVAEGGKVYVMTAQRSDEHGHDQWEWYQPDQFLKLTKSVMKLGGIEVDLGDGKTKTVPAGQYWLETSTKKQTYVGTALEPLQGERTRDGRLNLWRGFAVEEREGDWSLLREHVHEVLCDGDTESSEYILSWLARAIQRPDEPGEVALVMQGGMGVGKGALGSALARLFGPHGAEIRSREHLTGRFNYHLRDKCVLFADEAVWSGNKEAESILKGMITEKNLAYERKGADIVWGRNRLHIIMASNEEWVAPVAWDDRRYAIFRTRQVKRDRVYFDRLFRQLDGGGYAAMLWDLKRRDLSLFHVLDDRPNTIGLREQKRQSMKPAERWLLNILENGEFKEMVVVRPSGAMVFKHDLQSSYMDFMSSEGLKSDQYTGLSEIVGKVVTKMLPNSTVTMMADSDGDRKRAYRFLGLDEMISFALSNASSS